MAEAVGRARWIAKKASRRAFAIAGRVATSPRARTTRHVRALMYHRVRQVPREPFSVAPEDFERQMAWLAEKGLAVSLDAVEGWLAGTHELPDGAALVTIDDGYRDAYTAALPILRRHGVRAVLFVTVGAIEERTGPPTGADAGEAHVSWTELAELRDAGVVVGSHGWDHRSLGKMPAADVDRQLARSRATLEQRLGIDVRAFAYPFGTFADYSGDTRDALVRADYRSAFTAQHGAISSGVDTLSLPRVKVEGGEGMWMFRQLLGGGLDGWSVVDRYLWRLQAAEAS